MDDKKPLIWMILFGLVRAGMLVIGTKLEQNGLIDSDTKQRLVSEGVTQVVGYLLIAAPVIWSVLQKVQVIAWVKSAIDSPSRATPSDALQNAPGPNVPV